MVVFSKKPCSTARKVAPSFLHTQNKYMSAFRIIPRAMAAGLFLTLVNAQETQPAPVAPESVKPDSSYALGYQMGNMFSQQFGNHGVGMDDLEMEHFIKGFGAAVRGKPPEVAEERLQASMQALGDMIQKREEALAAANLKAGEEFLASNAKREGVITNASGFQYEIIEKGGEEKYLPPKDGEEDNKEFHVNYKGSLIDGTEFDASPPGETFPMTLDSPDGFKEALTSMPVGAKWKIYLPAKLAYGEQRLNAEVGPNSVLVFEIELVKIQDAPAPQGFPFPMPEQMPGQ